MSNQKTLKSYSSIERLPWLDCCYLLVAVSINWFIKYVIDLNWCNHRNYIILERNFGVNVFYIWEESTKSGTLWCSLFGNFQQFLVCYTRGIGILSRWNPNFALLLYHCNKHIQRVYMRSEILSMDVTLTEACWFLVSRLSFINRAIIVNLILWGWGCINWLADELLKTVFFK